MFTNIIIIAIFISLIVLVNFSFSKKPLKVSFNLTYTNNKGYNVTKQFPTLNSLEVYVNRNNITKFNIS